jgi:integrase
MAKYKKRPDGRYEVKITLGIDPDGKYIRKGIYGRTIAELEENVRQAKNQFEQGVDLLAQKPTVKVWADKWLEVYKPDIARSMRSVYMGMINKWLHPLHGLKVDKVRQVQLQEILQSASQSLSQSSIDKLYNCIRGIFSTARHNGLTVKDVSEFISKPLGGAKNRREALAEKEKDMLVKACTRDPAGAIPMIMMYAGLRIGEVLALSWRDIKDGWINVTKTIVFEENSNKPTIKNSPKTDAGFRKVPIIEPLTLFLSGLEKSSNVATLPSSPIFTSNGRLYSKIMQRRFWERIIGLYVEEWNKDWLESHQPKRNFPFSEIPPQPRKITSHMLRHTYITILYDAGIDVKTAQKWAGHATVAVLMDIYTHLSEGKEKEAVSKLNSFISGNQYDDNSDDIDDSLTTQKPVYNRIIPAK